MDARMSIAPRARGALTLGLAALLATAGVTALSGTARAASTLGAAAAEKGRYFGAAVAANHLGESAYAGTLNTEFNSVTPENEMKWDATESTRGSFTYSAADQIVSHITQPCLSADTLPSATIRCRQDRRQHPPDHQGQGQRVIPAPEATSPNRALRER